MNHNGEHFSDFLMTHCEDFVLSLCMYNVTASKHFKSYIHLMF